MIRMSTPAAEPPFRLPLIAILRGIRPAEVLLHVQTLVDAGFDAIEIPLNSPDWRDSIEVAVREFGKRARIGGGTVLHEADVDALKQLGAGFAVTPNTRPGLIRHAADRGLPVVAGFATPSEAFAALAAGARMLKLFPAAFYGPDYLRALRSVLPPVPPVPLFAVGGVGPAALAGFLAAGASGAGIGSELYTAGQPVSRTQANAQAFVHAYRKAAA